MRTYALQVEATVTLVYSGGQAVVAVNDGGERGWPCQQAKRLDPMVALPGWKPLRRMSLR
jgi:hypothetical protein